MINVVVVLVPETKNIYFLNPNMFDLSIGDNIIFETNNGLLCGMVIKNNYFEKKENLVLPLYSVIRLCNDDDYRNIDINKKNAFKALSDAKKISKNLSLEMNFIDSYFNFDKTQLVLSFLSDTRVDFRELAKKLAQKYKTRIELRQIGVRDKSKRNLYVAILS